MQRQLSLGRFVTFPENQSAWTAIQQAITCLRADKPRGVTSPLFLHGPPGVGKTHLVSGFAQEVSAKGGQSVTLVAASDFRELRQRHQHRAVTPEQGNLATDEAAFASSSLVADCSDSDVLIVEDVQHLPLAAAETLVQIIDHRLAQERCTICTACVGPGHLAYRGVRFPSRLTSRLGAGLVVALEPLQPSSRRLLLEELAQRIQLALPRDILDWLTDNLTGGGREIVGAIGQLETLSKVNRAALNVKSVAAHFRVQEEANRPSVERIAALVGGYFRVEPRQLRSRRRFRNVLVPRQVSMYLARQLTPLSLEHIGKYFGGLDHTTVLHACRKIELAMQRDAVLSGTVRQIHAELA